MKKAWKVVFISVVLMGLFPQIAGAQTSELKSLVIESVRTAGNRNISSAQILAKVRSRAGQMFDPDMAAEDAKRIAGLGGVEYSYYNTVIADDKIQLTFVVVEKNIIRSIAFIGNCKYKAAKLRGKLGFKIADYIDPIAAQAGSKAIAEFYHSKGFAFAVVTVDSARLEAGEVVYTIDEGPRVKIEAVRLVGNNALKTAGLKKVLKTRENRFLLLQGYYVEEKTTEDVTRLQEVYQRKGFLDAAVTAEREFNQDKSKVRITFAINEGQVYTVERLELSGNNYFTEEQLRKQLTLERGQPYSEQKAVADSKEMLKLYRENGFIDAEVENRRSFVSPGRVAVGFDIKEGGRFRIGQVNITGNEQTQDKVVRRVLDEYDFQPGRWYNADIARGDGSGDLEKKVRQNAMAEATITPSGKMPDQRDAHVNIIEGQTGMVMVGAGVASDSGLIGQMVFEQRNFDIADWPESFGEFITGKAFKGAGQSLRIALQPGTEVSEYSISFSEPYFRNKPISMDVVGSSYQRDRESYDEQRTKGYVGFEKRYKDNWRRGIGFRAEKVDIDSLDFDAPKEVVDDRGSNLLGGVKLSVGRDLTDDRFNPSTGYNFDAGYEQVAGDYTFGILSGVYRRYQTIYTDLAERKTVLATKLLAATVIGDAPVFEKFYAGGSGTYGIRGFDYRGVSTRGLQRNVLNPERKDPIGSDWIFLANAEVTVPLVSENFAALFFVDSGTVDSGNYRVAAGVGIQILIPQWFGPVPMRFELAAPLMKDKDDETQVFSFSVGRLF